jgi:CRISPR-associated endonuclease Csn1
MYNKSIEQFKKDLDGKYILSFDIGANSLGWAVVLCEDDTKNPKEPIAKEIIRAGVNIFPAGVDKLGLGDKEASRAVNRREKRQIRRQLMRKSARRERLFKDFIEIGFLPKDINRNIFASPDCPYEIRKKALDEKVELEELARALYHINNRRGFKSSAKDRGAKDTNTIHTGAEENINGEKIITKPGINDITNALSSGKYRTIGEYLASKDGQDGFSEKRRSRYTLRKHFEDEVEIIWESQQRFHNGRLSGGNLKRIKETIFFQRDLKSQKNHRRKCPITYKKHVVRKSNPLFQEYRLWCVVNNLIIKEEGRFAKPIELSTDDRKAIYSKMAEKDKVKFDNGNKWLQPILGLPKGTRFITNYDGKTIKSLSTLYRIINSTNVKSADGKKDTARSKKNRNIAEKNFNEIYLDLLYAVSEEWMINRAIEKYGFDEDVAVQISKVVFEDFYGSYSQFAIREILPYLESGLGEHYARKQAYTDGKFDKWQKYKPTDGDTGRYIEEVQRINNPVVNASLQTLKKVYNELAFLYGSPRVIKIELARDIKQSKEGRKNTNDKINSNEKRNDSVRDLLAEHNIHEPKKWMIEKVKLWQDQDERCIYSGEQISFNDLLYGGIDVDHILPYSKTFDNSYLNKVVCTREENLAKGNRLPFEAFESTPGKYDEVMARAKKYFHIYGDKKRKDLMGKFNRFERDSLKDSDEFISQQLNDTRYIGTETVKMLEKVCDDVRTSKGSTTGHLRKCWELNGLLAEHQYIDPLRTKKKDRLDNRHHALDAIVIAYTTRSHVKQIADELRYQDEEYQRTGAKPRYWEICDKIDVPTVYSDKKEFRDKVELVLENILVVHKPDRKLRGGFHGDTFYGWRKDEKGDRIRDGKSALLHVRKPIANLTMKQIGADGDSPSQIADPRIREAILKAIRRAGYDPKTIKDKDAQKILARGVKHYFPRSKRELPIKAVKLIIRKEQPIKIADYDKYVLADNNFCMAYYKNEDGKIKAESVSMFEACRKFPGKKVSEELKNDANGTEEFLVYLQNRDTIIADGFPDGFSADDPETYNMISKDISRVMTWAGTSKQLWHLNNIYSLDKMEVEENVFDEKENKREYKTDSVTLTKSYMPGSYPIDMKKLRLSHTGLIEDWF